MRLLFHCSTTLSTTPVVVIAYLTTYDTLNKISNLNPCIFCQNFVLQNTIFLVNVAPRFPFKRNVFRVSSRYLIYMLFSSHLGDTDVLYLSNLLQRSFEMELLKCKFCLEVWEIVILLSLWLIEIYVVLICFVIITMFGYFIIKLFFFKLALEIT